MARIFYTAKKTVKEYAQGGNVLIVATILALIVANIPGLNNYYFELWNKPVSLEVGGFNVFSHHGETMSFMQFINASLINCMNDIMVKRCRSCSLSMMH